MCTVTLVRTDAGFRLVCNRDERRSRAVAAWPEVRGSSAGRVLHPVDPDSGGTWLGVNDAGLAACLLNANPPGAGVAAGLRSRGEIVPRVLGAGSLRAALGAALGLEVREFPPFRLLLADLERTVVVSASGGVLRAQVVPSGGPGLMLTSSSLGDDVVEGVRRELFNALMAGAAEPLMAQRAFHEHRWEDRPQVSVSMRRGDARTVSRTVVELDASGFTMVYSPLAEDGSEGGQRVERRLACSAGCFRAGVVAAGVPA